MKRKIKIVVFVLMFSMILFGMLLKSFAEVDDSNIIFTTVNQTVYAIGRVNIKIGCEPDSTKLGVLQKGDSITRIGIGNNGFSKVKYNNEIAYISTDYLTTTTPENLQKQKEATTIEPEKEELTVKSNNSYLQSLEILNLDVEQIDFNKEIKQYELTVESSVKELEIEALPESEKALVRIDGNLELRNGENIIEIVVTAEDNSSSVYTLIVNRKEDLNEEIIDKVEVQESKNNNENNNVIWFVVAAIILLIIFLCFKKPKKGKRAK